MSQENVEIAQRADGLLSACVMNARVRPLRSLADSSPNPGWHFADT
jgi:hypothetical protein